MKKIGKLLLVILCALLLVTGCGKKEDKAKITLTKSQIKYEENAKDILNEYINIRLELMSLGELSNKDEVSKKINNLYERLEKLDSALTALEIASDEINKTKSEAKIIAMANNNMSEIFIKNVYAAESTEATKKWAEDITKAYDSYPTGKQLRGLAAYLGTDVKTAMKQLQVAQGVMYNEYENEADMYDDLKDIAEVVQTTCKVELFVAGFPANGVTTLTEAGVTLLNGVDTLVAVSLIAASRFCLACSTTLYVFIPKACLTKSLDLPAVALIPPEAASFSASFKFLDASPTIPSSFFSRTRSAL